MTLSGALALVLALAAVPLWPAAAQQEPSPGCQLLVATRDEVQKHAQALQFAGQKKAASDEVCRLFKAYLAAELTLIRGLEDLRATCGVPAGVIVQVKASHRKAAQMSQQVCYVATRAIRRFDAPVPQCSEKTLRPGVPCVD
jgi:hypothetical protein